MIRYSGTLSIAFTGTVEGGGSYSGLFEGEYSVGVGVQAVFLGGTKIYTAGGGGSGTLTTTLTTAGGTETGSRPLSILSPLSFASPGSVPVILAPAGFGSLSMIGGGLSAQGAEVVVASSGSFDAVLDGVRVTGTATASGTLGLVGSLYSVGASAGAGAEEAGGFGFVVERRGDMSVASSVSWWVDGSGAAAADAADFMGGVLPGGILDFAPGETTKTLDITVAGDRDFEPDEGFTLHVADLSDGFLPLATSAGMTILNDDVDAAVSVAALDAVRAEGNAGETAFTFALTRSGDVSGAASVGWQAVGSGVRPADAADFAGGVLPGGSVDFAAGETGRVLTVMVAGDALREGNEGFSVTLSAQAGAGLGTVSAEGTILADEAIDDFVVVDPVTGLGLPVAPGFYGGPVAGVQRELLAVLDADVTVVAGGPNWFVHTGGGDDAIRAMGGRNVLDGGGGSNFLTGADGVDSFFLDARGAAAGIWSTLVGFGAGDDATIWGLGAAATLIWQDGAGAPGFTGLTLHAQMPGQPFASLTLAGFTDADRIAGRVVLSAGHDAASDSDFLFLSLG